MIRSVYTALYHALLPILLLRLHWRGRLQPEYRKRWRERFARGPVPKADIWIHAVSVGEVNAAQPLVERLIHRHPALHIAITTGTPTGSARVRELFHDKVAHCYLPFDVPGATRRFLAGMAPQLGLVMETELWPNLFLSCVQRGLPLALVNGRLSARSARGYRSVPGLSRTTLQALSLALVQDNDTAARLRSLGLPKQRIAVTGNLKYDHTPDPTQLAEGRALRRQLGEGRPWWIAASTHAGEETKLLSIHQRLLTHRPECGLIVAPRHPQRFDAVADEIRRLGLRLQRRSDGESPRPDCQVYLADTMGELGVGYAAADVAFVGGSLARVGGHNLLEALAAGTPALVGPHHWNFARITHDALAAGAALEVPSAAGLQATLLDLLQHSGHRQTMRDAAGPLLAHHRGATDRVLDALSPLIPSCPRPRSAPRPPEAPTPPAH